MTDNLVWNKTDTRTLFYGGQFSDLATGLRAKTFEVMLELAAGRIQEYQSDLFHDALWLNERLIGPMRFDWIVRSSGTFIGDSVLHIKTEEWSGSVKYRFELYNDDGRWNLSTYEAMPLSTAQSMS